MDSDSASDRAESETTSVGPVRLSFVSHVHSYITEYVKLADTKAGLIAAAAGVLLGIVFRRVETWQPVAQVEFLPVLRFGLAFAAVVSLILTLFCALCALRPRLPASGSGLVGFPDLANLGRAEYIARLKITSDSRLIEELAEHSVDLSVIALAKNRLIGKAVFPLMVAIAAVALLIWL